MMQKTQKIYLAAAWLLSVIAMGATLYGSEWQHLPICHLCWYQRITMYPLVLILGIACYRAETVVVPYVIALPWIGAALALYQYAQQMVPDFAPIDLCGVGPSCAQTDLLWFGFITLAFMSFIAHLAIGLLLWLSRRDH